ncbi:hypothetical protein [Streptomyces sp. NPDC046759]
MAQLIVFDAVVFDAAVGRLKEEERLRDDARVHLSHAASRSACAA